jgi:hypothetical protein
MARKRTPSPEQQTSDRSVVAGCAQILSTLAVRYPAALEAAVTLLRAFAASTVEVSAARKARTKAKSPAFDAAAFEAAGHEE